MGPRSLKAPFLGFRFLRDTGQYSEGLFNAMPPNVPPGDSGQPGQHPWATVTVGLHGAYPPKAGDSTGSVHLFLSDCTVVRSIFVAMTVLLPDY
jgi:hypothetical protein